MKQSRAEPVLNQMHIRGQYESTPTDTAFLAAELSVPQDVVRLIRDFDDGATPVRDVGRMLIVHRWAILEAYQSGTLVDLASTHRGILSRPVQNLHNRVTSGIKDQPIGHNFFVNATGFIDVHLPWARQFDDLLCRRTGASIYDIAESNDSAGKDRLLAAITKNPDEELMIALAVYLAGRSLEGEKYLKQHYGEVLEHAKGNVYATTQSIGSTTGLRIDMLERAAGQLQRSTFGSFDHLNGLVTSDDSGVAGDYGIGSLRIEVHFEGGFRSVRNRSLSDVDRIVTHELHHASSAQMQNNYRCGLQVNGEGLEANEGMTEYLAQLSSGGPGIVREREGIPYIREGVPYRVPVFAMLELHEQYKAGISNYFAVLFNAYHGDVRNKAELEQALDIFYQYDSFLSDQL